jgi:hypothetical protein
MSNRQKLGFIGCALLIVGVFLPILSAPFVGSINFFNDGQGDGLLVLILALISAGLVWVKRYKILWGTGLIALAITAYDLLNIQNTLGSSSVARSLIRTEWGWIVLIAGGVLVVATAWVKEERVYFGIQM